MKLTVAGGGFTYERGGRWNAAAHGEHLDLTSDDRIKAALASGVLVKGHVDPSGAPVQELPPAPPPAPTPAPATTVDAQPDADAPIDDQLDWIGDDADRARLVLEQEQGRPASEQRPTLIEGLEQLLGYPAEQLTGEQVSGMTVDDVNAYLAEHPDQRDHVLALEAAGQNRKGIVEA